MDPPSPSEQQPLAYYTLYIAAINPPLPSLDTTDLSIDVRRDVGCPRFLSLTQHPDVEERGRLVRLILSLDLLLMNHLGGASDKPPREPGTLVDILKVTGGDALLEHCSVVVFILVVGGPINDR